MAEKNELINARDLGETIKEKVKGLFLDAIPDDAWNTLIRGEIDAFFNQEIKHKLREIYSGSAGRRIGVEGEMTPFRALVFEALAPLVKERLRAALEDEQFAAHLQYVADGSGGTTTEAKLSAFFEAKLKEMAPDMVAMLFRSMFAHAAEQAVNAVRNGTY